MRGSRGNTGGVKIRSSDKDQLIAELRQQLYDLKNQERDYRGVNDEIFSMENRYKLLSEEKVRSEMEGRSRLDRGMDEIAECRKQIKTSNTCFLKNPDKTWSFKMSKVDPKESSMKNSSKLVKTEMKATPKETASSTSDLKLLSLKEILISLNLKELTCSEKLPDSEMYKT